MNWPFQGIMLARRHQSMAMWRCHQPTHQPMATAQHRDGTGMIGGPSQQMSKKSAHCSVTTPPLSLHDFSFQVLCTVWFAFYACDCILFAFSNNEPKTKSKQSESWTERKKRKKRIRRYRFHTFLCHLLAPTRLRGTTLTCRFVSVGSRLPVLWALQPRMRCQKAPSQFQGKKLQASAMITVLCGRKLQLC